MAEYVNENKPIIIKNETDSDFNVGAGIVFRKSGIYEITVTDSTITVTKVSERKTGRWIPHLQDARGYADEYECSACKRFVHFPYPTRICDYEYCPYCNAKME